MIFRHDPAPSGRTRIRRVGAAVIAAFWALQFGESSVISYFEDGAHVGAAFLPRVAVLTLGVLVSFALVETTILLLRRPFHQRLIAAACASTAGWMLISYFNFRVFQHQAPFAGIAQLTFVVVLWSWFLYSLAGAILAVAYYVEVSEKDRRLAELGIVARDAQLRALRYQLNPHFLFNALNSVASLISGGRSATAEHVVESLSDFLRSTLALDPVEHITLAKELELQRLYLDVEMIRYPDRLKTEVDVPEALRSALVPSLITQAVIENAVRHSVARSRSEVTIGVVARSAAGVLELQVTDRGGIGGCPPPGTGIGLRNVADRLTALFDEQGRLDAAALPEGGFRVTMTMPLRFPV